MENNDPNDYNHLLKIFGVIFLIVLFVGAIRSCAGCGEFKGSESDEIYEWDVY